MLDQHPAFTFADPIFYDSPANWIVDAERFDVADREPPGGWRRDERDVWVGLTPPGRAAAQGWKVHVSATPDSAEKTLSLVWDFCVEHSLAFKFLFGRHLVTLFNSKYVPRENSGKVAVIYPADEATLATVLRELGARLDGAPGPYVLSDLRHGPGPLHVRYGGFAERYLIDDRGEASLAIQDPEGRLVPDHRRPVFRHPEWVSLPECVRPDLEARSHTAGSELPYRITSALHFSNGGGVYLARRKEDGAEIVVKEARPHAGLDRQGRDALTRLNHERTVLERLAGVPGVPECLGYHQVWEHGYLAMGRVPGDIAWKWLGSHHPLLDPGHTEQDLRVYVARATRLLAKVRALVSRLHARGIVFGDLHPGNLLVTEDGEVGLVDFEAAGDTDDPNYSPPLAAQGFAPWRHGHGGTAADEHALAVLSVWLFLPMNVVWALDPGKLLEHVTEIERIFPLPPGYCDGLAERLALPAEAGHHYDLLSGGRPLEVALDVQEPDLDALRASLTAAIVRSATPQRADRLFPGDVRQFSYDGVGFAYGAAGVLWALAAAGAPIEAAHERWFIQASERPLRPRPGFWTGLHGIAHVLARLGHPDRAGRLVEEAEPHVPTLRSAGLFRGLAGIGLNHLYLHRCGLGDRFVEQAHSLASRLAHAVEAESRRRDGAGITDERELAVASQPGLMHGWTGVALMLVRLFETDGDRRWLSAAVRALHLDLDACITTSTGSLQIQEGSRRTLAYLEGGSGGIALVAEQLLRHHPDHRLRESIPAILRACEPEYVTETHLFNGRAGLMAMLSRLASHADEPTRARAAVIRHVRRLSWHALSYHGQLAFPGDRSFRLSMDLATGNAGVLLAVTTAADPARSFLPFLDPLADGERPLRSPLSTAAVPPERGGEV